MNTTQYIAVVTFHVMTDSMFLAADRAAALASQVYDLYQLMNTNFSSLTPNERAELIAERIADIIKTIFADLVTRKTLASAGGGAAGASSATTTQEVHEVVASDGIKVQVRGEDNASILKNDQKIAGSINQEMPEWIPYDYKHVASSNKPWKEVVKSTKSGVAKYKPEFNIKILEETAWIQGIPVKDTNYKIYDCKKIIGAKNGIETNYMIVKNSANTLHGHPITSQEFTKYLKK